MTLYLKKLRLIGLPFGLCLLALLVVYTLYNWLFFVFLGLISWDNIITNYIIPIVIACILIYFYIKPNVKKFHFNDYRKKDFFYILLAGALCAPTIMVQEYMEIVTGRITKLNTIKEIDDLPITKYYSLNQYYLYKEAVSTKLTTEVSGKHNQDLNINLHVVQPILERPSDKRFNATHYWFCTKFHKRISNRLSQSEKEKYINKFLYDCQNEFETTTPSFSYLERDSRSNILKYYGKAGSNSKLNRNGADIFLFPQKGAYADRTGNRLQWIFIIIGILSSLVLLLLYFIPLKTKAQLSAMKKKEQKESAKSWQKKYEWIVPAEGFQTTPYLIFALVGIYLLMVLSGYGFFQIETNALYDWGALFRPIVVNGEWWRIITAMFLHGSIIHLLNNLFCLYFASIFLESVLGSTKLFILYLVCGIGASIASLLYHDDVISVGASGAIFGLFGFLLALQLFGSKKLKLSFPLLYLSPIFIVINLIIGYVTPAVDNAGHVGGLITGLVLGALFYPWIEEEAID